MLINIFLMKSRFKILCAFSETKGTTASRPQRTISIIIGETQFDRSSTYSSNSTSSHRSSTQRRLEAVFRDVGWPVTQSGLSTIIGMCPLLAVKAYVVAVFWKTILLVTVLGLFHALWILPVFFLLISDIMRWLRMSSKS
ncbi:hypothetical protein AB6A40_010320 [Gnathostoma spinigerum]|uniref:Uncharacterized protein n=1 Tax=Gnathostoma spinigerum TaxID=75299 RepID=A0ABD6EW81_9BILA